jgi:hypothetical protein
LGVVMIWLLIKQVAISFCFGPVAGDDFSRGFPLLVTGLGVV